MQIVESAIAALSPRWAVQRMYSRALLASGKRAYDAAKRDRNTDGWRTTGGSANAEIGPALGIIRQRSHDLCRNNPLAASARRKLGTHIVGTGIKPRPADADRPNKTKLISNWSTFVEHSDPEGRTSFYGQMKLAVECVVESGEALIRWYDRPAGKEFPSLLQCEVLEPDFLDILKSEELPNGNLIIQGVEFDGYGRRAAYWLFDRHPGDLSLIRGSTFVSRRVPGDQVTHVFDRQRPGQVRGVPWFAPVLISMRDIDDYEFAERLRKKIAACYSVFIKRDPMISPIPLGGTEIENTIDVPTGRLLEKVSPGAINYLNLGEEPVTSAPAQSDIGYADYMIMQMQAIAAGIGIPYHVMTGDLRQANYSSLREGKLDFWALIDDWQKLMLIPQLCAPAWSRVHDVHRRMGNGPREWSPALWQIPRRPWVDPKAESEAEDLEFENGTKTWIEAQHERGNDPEEVLAELEQIMPRLEALGIDLFGQRQPMRGNPNANQQPNAQAA